MLFGSFHLPYILPHSPGLYAVLRETHTILAYLFFVTIIAHIDNSVPIEYNPARDPNYLSFHISDTLGNTAKVVYHFEKPYDLEKAERITLKGRMNGDVFEITRKDGILLKCPSKYKDDPNTARKALSQN